MLTLVSNPQHFRKTFLNEFSDRYYMTMKTVNNRLKDVADYLDSPVNHRAKHWVISVI